MCFLTFVRKLGGESPWQQVALCVSVKNNLDVNSEESLPRCRAVALDDTQESQVRLEVHALQMRDGGPSYQ